MRVENDKKLEAGSQKLEAENEVNAENIAKNYSLVSQSPSFRVSESPSLRVRARMRK